MSQDDQFSAEPLSELERRRLRRLLRDEDRTNFFWRTLRIWLGWASGVVAAIWLGWDTMAKIARALWHAMAGTPP